MLRVFLEGYYRQIHYDRNHLVCNSSVLKSSFSIGILTFISRVLGFSRDILLAYFLGATMMLDAFIIAFKLPNLFRRVYAEGVLAQALIPKINKNQKDNDILLAEVLGSLGSLLVCSVLILMIFSPMAVMLLAPGFIHQAAKLQLASQLLRMTAPYLGFIVLTGIYAAFLNANKRFALPAALPIILNLVLIIILLTMGKRQALVYWLAMSVSIVGIIQLSFAAMATYQNISWQWPRLAWYKPKIRQIAIGLLPTIIAVSVVYIGFFIDTLFASTLPTGSISWLYYSERLIILPISLIGAAVATTLLPHLSHATKQQSSPIAVVLLLGLPAAIGLVMLARPIVSTLYYHGAFTRVDLAMTWACLRAFAFGVPAFIAVKIIATYYFAEHEIKYPFICASIAIFVNILLNVILIKTFAAPGLALATTIAGWLNVILLGGHYFCKKVKITMAQIKWLLKCLCANVVLIAILYFTKDSNSALQLAITIMGAMIIYAIALYVLRIFPVNESRID